jgi:uncharacterized protein YraI
VHWAGIWKKRGKIMNDQTKSRNIWWVLGLIGLVIVGVVAIAYLVSALFGSGGGAAEGPEAELPTPAPGTPSATALEAIHVRSGPGTLYPSYGVAPKGASAEVIGVSSSGQWWVVKMPSEIAPGGQGWVFGEYVQVSGGENVPVVPTPPQPPSVEPPPPPSGAPTATTLEAVNIRSGPGTQYPAYGVAPKGAKGEVIGVSEDSKWWVINLPTSLVGAGQGWVSADWVTTSNTEGVPVVPPPDQEPPVDVPPPSEGVPTATALDYINVRSGPGVQYASYGVAQPGASAEIIGKSADGKWWVIKLPSVAEGQGWVSADWVQASDAGGVPVIPAP